MLIGYARVSTLDQNPNHQIDALNEAGCKKIFTEKYRVQVSNVPNYKQLLIICVKAIRL